MIEHEVSNVARGADGSEMKKSLMSRSVIVLTRGVRWADGVFLLSNVIPAKAGTQSKGRVTESLNVSVAVANAAIAASLTLDWVPACFALAPRAGMTVE